jgi:hypothetical protein
MADYEHTLTGTSIGVPSLLVFDAYRRVLPVAEVAIGVQWQTGPWFVSTGWELMHWGSAIDVIEFPLANQDVTSQQGRSIRRVADITLDGWFLRGGVSW